MTRWQPLSSWFLSAALLACSGGSVESGPSGGGGDGPSGGHGDGGGTSGTSSGGSSSSGHVTVKPCDAVSGDEWTLITPPGVDFTGAIALDPLNPGRIWLNGRGQGVFRSDDCGATWDHLNQGKGADILDGGDGGAIFSMAVDPTDSNVLYVAGYADPTNLWKSTDAGTTWEALFSPESELAGVLQSIWFESISLDPMNTQHLVAASHDVCSPPYNDGCQVESMDAGKTWKIVKNPEGAGWAENGGALALGDTTWIYGQPFGKLWLTTDHGDSWQDVTPPGGAGTSGGFSTIPVRASDDNFYLPTLYGILRSPDGLAWEKVPNLDGKFVGFVVAGDRLFAADQWSNTYRVAKVGDLSQWTELPPPAALPADQGAPFLAYDDAHHLLYSSNFAGGIWRKVIH